MAEFVEEIIFERDIECKNCGYADLWKSGMRKDVQFYKCKNCFHRYSDKDTYIGYRYEKETIVKALEYFYGGMSFGIIKNKFDNLENMGISKSTLWEWVTKFTNIVISYLKNIKPTNIGDSWYADETMIKMHGQNRWLWSVIDEDTRYLLACNFTTSRTTQAATKLFQDAYATAGRKPYVIYTDKLQAYGDAINKLFYSNIKEHRVHHIKSIGAMTPININLIERWHEYVKQRTKIMRHFKTPESAYTILRGIIINYNYLWEHSSLDYVPPAQKAGIDLKDMEIKNWGDLIERAIENS